MSVATRIFEVERLGGTVVLTPQHDPRELEFQEIERELSPLAADPAVRRVVVDFVHTDYLGSTALGMLAWLGMKVRVRGGRMALCNVSAHEREIFAMAGLADLWPVFPSRRQALEAVAA